MSNANECKNFVSQFPSWMQSPVCAIMGGELYTIKTYEAYEACHEDSPTQGQHPHYASSSDSDPHSATKFIMGSGHLGETLVYRVPGNLWTNKQGDLTLRAWGYNALVTMKHIEQVSMTTSDKSELVKILARSSLEGNKFTDTLPPVLQKVVRERSYFAERVRDKGFNYYERIGLNLGENEETKMARSIAAEIGFENLRAVGKMHGAPETVFALQMPAFGRYLHWLGEEGKFVSVPMLGNKVGIEEYLGKIPANQREAGVRFVNGLSRLVSVVDETNGIRFSNISSSSCTDSRTAQNTVVGKLQELDCHVLRTPGNFWADANGTLSQDAAVFVALAAMRGDVVVKSNEATCGAGTAVHVYNESPEIEGRKLPKAFQELGREMSGLHRAVLLNGIESYRNMGVNVEDPIACITFEALCRDCEIASRSPDAPPIISVYQNIPERMNYVRNPKSGIFVPVLPAPDAPSTNNFARVGKMECKLA